MFHMLFVIVGDMAIIEIIANLNVFELSKRWASSGVSRHIVTVPLDRCSDFLCVVVNHNRYSYNVISIMMCPRL